MYFRFDEFNLIRQAILLTIDTFGFSHIFPIFGLPFLVACCCLSRQTKQLFSLRLCQVNFLLENFIYNFNGFWAVITDTVMFQVYLMYGLITAVSVTFTILCVTIQRRHLMVYTHICRDLHTFEILNESVDTMFQIPLQVWGLFAPKFVFDVVGLVLTDIMICLSSLYYMVWVLMAKAGFLFVPWFVIIHRLFLGLLLDISYLVFLKRV